MAAPVVSGAIALLVERYRAVTGGVTPTPQLIRALLAETAVDLGFLGPDYAYGWGLMDARAALEVIDVDEGSGWRFVFVGVFFFVVCCFVFVFVVVGFLFFLLV